jgi:hypothetical protein
LQTDSVDEFAAPGSNIQIANGFAAVHQSVCDGAFRTSRFVEMSTSRQKLPFGSQANLNINKLFA